MHFDFEFNQDSFNKMSPRRRWFLVGLAMIIFTTFLDFLPGDLPVSIGIMAMLGLVLGIVLCVIMIATKYTRTLTQRDSLNFSIVTRTPNGAILGEQQRADA